MTYARIPNFSQPVPVRSTSARTGRRNPPLDRRYRNLPDEQQPGAIEPWQAVTPVRPDTAHSRSLRFLDTADDDEDGQHVRILDLIARSPALRAQPPVEWPTSATCLVDQINFASASLDELQSLHDLADAVSTFAYALVWTGRCHTRGWDKTKGPERQYNAAGKLMQWLGDALTDVETAAHREARQREAANSSDRASRLSVLAVTTIDNGDPDEIEAFAHELLAHAEAERQGR